MQNALIVDNKKIGVHVDSYNNIITGHKLNY